MTGEEQAIRCPRCGAYITEEIPKGVSYLKCPYCNTTVLIPKKEAHQQIQPVVVYAPDEARQIKEYGKLVEEMTGEELDKTFDKDFGRGLDQARAKELEEKKRKEGLTPKEERELVYSTRASTDENFSMDGQYCLSCYRKNEYYCVKCGTGTCGNPDCEFTLSQDSKFVVTDIRSRVFSLYCPNCKGYVCQSCYTTQETVLFGDKYYCQKCQTRLEKKPLLGTC
jgi:DNA-directed RNA polymerase subunit RPC12/RpoP